MSSINVFNCSYENIGQYETYSTVQCTHNKAVLLDWPYNIPEGQLNQLRTTNITDCVRVIITDWTGAIINNNWLRVTWQDDVTWQDEVTMFGDTDLFSWHPTPDWRFLFSEYCIPQNYHRQWGTSKSVERQQIQTIITRIPSFPSPPSLVIGKHNYIYNRHYKAKFFVSRPCENLIRPTNKRAVELYNLSMRFCEHQITRYYWTNNVTN